VGSFGNLKQKQMNSLTPKQELFAQLVASGETYSDAYRKAYDVSPEIKIKTIWEKSSELMSNGKVSARVKEIQTERLKQNEVTLQEVLKELSEWLRFNVKTIFNTDGTMKQLHEMTDQEASCIASYEVVELFGGSGENRAQIGQLKKVKLIDKQAVADKFLRYFGAYIENHKVSIEDLSHLDDILKGIKR
jgi:phage terminase small subunit